jgi:hypothetical protein
MLTYQHQKNAFCDGKIKKYKSGGHFFHFSHFIDFMMIYGDNKFRDFVFMTIKKRKIQQ